MTAFWQSKDPVRVYLAAFQQFAGAPISGVWDRMSHAALYKIAHTLNAEISADVPWGAEPSKTVEYLLSLAQDTDDPDSFTFARPFLVALGFPAMTFEDAGKWTENLDPKEAEVIEAALKRVAETVGQAETVASTAPAATAVDPQPASPADPAPATPATPVTPPPVPGVPTPGVPPTVTVTAVQNPPAVAGMSKKAKIVIGVVGGIAAVTIAALAWKAFSKPKEPAMGDLGEFDGLDGFDGAGLGECPCKKKHRR